MTKGDILMLDFADNFEQEFIHQGAGRRAIGQTLDIGIAVLKKFGLEVS